MQTKTVQIKVTASDIRNGQRRSISFGDFMGQRLAMFIFGGAVASAWWAGAMFQLKLLAYLLNLIK